MYLKPNSYIPDERNSCTCLSGYVNKNVHNSLVCSSQHLQTKCPSVVERINKWWVPKVKSTFIPRITSLGPSVLPFYV